MVAVCALPPTVGRGEPVSGYREASLAVSVRARRSPEAEADDRTLERLRRFVAGWAAAEPGGRSSAVPTLRAARRAEGELAAWLAVVNGEAEATSFGLGDWGRGGWEEARRRWEDLVRQAERTLANYAWVETSVGPTVVGRTIVSWSGDFELAVSPRLSPVEAAAHQRQLGEALAARAAVLRKLILVLRGAAIVGAVVANPSGAILAIPAVMRFLEALGEEIS